MLPPSLEAVLRRDRALVLGGLVCVCALAWAYMIHLARAMDHASMPMLLATPHMEPWGATRFLFSLVMWSVMMVAMMVPTAAPMILLFATVNRRRHQQQDPTLPTGWFVLGYVSSWAAYSVFATVGQLGLHAASLLSPQMASNSPLLGGAILVTAGVFQFTPLKYACLKRCRSPLGFLLTEWREGNRGAFRMGLKGGNYCVGCCWALMALMFVGGVMSLLWMALLTVLTLLEKVLPHGRRLAWGAGIVLIVWGVGLLVRGIS